MEGRSQIPWVLPLATLAKCPCRHGTRLIVCGNTYCQAAHGTGVLRDMKRCGDETQDKANPLVNLVDGLGLIGTFIALFLKTPVP